MTKTALSLLSVMVLTIVGLGAMGHEEPVASRRCVACATGENVGCPDSFHKTWHGEDEVWQGVEHLNCVSGSCTLNHEMCDLGEDDFALVSAAAIAVDALTVDAAHISRLRSLLHVHRERAVLNVERSAIQVLGCQGSVIAHLPLPKELLGAVAQASD